jgi:predicted dehydrogenase
VGCGFVAHIHVNALSRVAGIEVEIAGIASRTKERVESFAKQCGINNCYTDYRYLLDSKDIDVIDVCVPNILHEKVCIETAMAGKHIICEKPLTGYFGQDLAETVENVGKTIPKRQMYVRAMESAQKIVQEAKSNKVKLCYAENYVYAPELTKAKRLIGASKGTILDIRAKKAHVSVRTLSRQRNGKWQEVVTLLRLGSHPLGAAIHLKIFEGLMTEG